MPTEIIKKAAETGQKITQKTTTITKSGAKKTVETTFHISNQFKYHTATAIIAAFSFLIALTWKDFIVQLVKDVVAVNFELLYLELLVTAIIVTIIAIVGIGIASHWAQRDKPQIQASAQS